MLCSFFDALLLLGVIYLPKSRTCGLEGYLSLSLSCQVSSFFSSTRLAGQLPPIRPSRGNHQGADKPNRAEAETRSRIGSLRLPTRATGQTDAYQ